jgi:hypothetical protein
MSRFIGPIEEMRSEFSPFPEKNFLINPPHLDERRDRDPPLSCTVTHALVYFLGVYLLNEMNGLKQVLFTDEGGMT